LFYYLQPDRLGQEKNLNNCGTTRLKSCLSKRDKIFGLWVEAEAVENQALKEFGNTELKGGGVLEENNFDLFVSQI